MDNLWIWLVVYLSPWKIGKSIRMTPNIWENKSHVPNHQPDELNCWFGEKNVDSSSTRLNMNSGLTLSLMTKCSLPYSLHSTKPFEVFQSCNLVVIWWIAHSTTGYPSTSLDCNQKWHCLENRGYTPKIDAVSRCHGNVLMKNMALTAKGGTLWWSNMACWKIHCLKVNFPLKPPF